MEIFTDENNTVAKLYNENGTTLALTECEDCSREFAYDGGKKCFFCKDYICRFCEKTIMGMSHRVIHAGRIMTEKHKHTHICNLCQTFRKFKHHGKEIKLLAKKEGWKK